MTDDEYIAFGSVQSTTSLQRLVEVLSKSGHPAELGESSHFKGGEYVRVKHGQALLTAERVDPSEYLLRGEAGEPDELRTLCEAVSSALRLSRVTHSIELYDGEDILRNKYTYEAEA